MVTKGMDKVNVNITAKEIKDILEDYKYDPDIMNDDPQKVRLAKMAIAKLSGPDRIIWCLAMDKQSSREVGKILGCSHSTVLKQLQKIKMEIMYHIMTFAKTEPLED